MDSTVLRSSVISLTFLICLALSGLASLTATTAWAEAAQGNLEERIIQGPGIADLIAYGYDNNTGIAAKWHSWRANIERYRVETGYPDPQLLATYYPDPIETRLGPQDWNITLSQQIPFPGKLTNMGKMVSHDAGISRLSLDVAVRDVIVAIRESHAELLYIQIAREIAAGNNGLLEKLRQVAETSHAEERATLTDVIKAQAQAGQLRYDVLLLEELEHTEKTRLNSLLNREPDAAIGPLSEEPIAPVVYELEEMYRLVEINNEEVRIAEEQHQKSLTQKSLAGYGYLPDFRVGLFYAEIGQPDVTVPPRDAGRDALGVQAGLTIPLWFGKNKGKLDLAKAEIEKTGAQKKDIINRTKASLREVFFRLHNAERLITLYRDDLLPQAVKSLQSLETWQRQGQGSFSDLIETQSTVYNFQLALARARADYDKYLARLERLCGITLVQRDDSLPGKTETLP